MLPALITWMTRNRRPDETGQVQRPQPLTRPERIERCDPAHPPERHVHTSQASEVLLEQDGPGPGRTT
jgi:hypothetical protein